MGAFGDFNDDLVGDIDSNFVVVVFASVVIVESSKNSENKSSN